jgi:hypothetical protein
MPPASLLATFSLGKEFKAFDIHLLGAWWQRSSAHWTKVIHPVVAQIVDTSLAKFVSARQSLRFDKGIQADCAVRSCSTRTRSWSCCGTNQLALGFVHPPMHDLAAFAAIERLLATRTAFSAVAGSSALRTALVQAACYGVRRLSP